MLGRAPPSEDGAAIEAIPVDEWVKGLRAAQEEARKLISANIEGEQQDRVASTPPVVGVDSQLQSTASGPTDCWRGSEQFGARRRRADGVRSSW